MSQRTKKDTTEIKANDDKDSRKQTEQKTPKQNFNKKESKVKVDERELRRMIKDLETTVEELKGLLIKKDEDIESISSESSASFESVRGFGSASTLRSEDTDLLLDELKHALEIQKLQEENAKIKQSEEENNNLKRESEKIRDFLAQKESEIIHLKEEIDNLRTRLSELAGAKLTYDNPAVQYLSDRPTKLAVKYSELYDNQWTDSFAELAKTNPKASEGDLTGQLLNILTDGFNFCKEVRNNQEINLEHLMLNPAQSTKSGQSSNKDQVNAIFIKHLSEAAKVSGNVTGENIIKAFVSNEKIKKKHGKLMKLCGTYIEDCVKLCWLMQVQTPHMCIDLKTHAGQTFVKDTYREYTSSGTKIAFVVWPALLLYENGPLLIKGVAQGK